MSACVVVSAPRCSFGRSPKADRPPREFAVYAAGSRPPLNLATPTYRTQGQERLQRLPPITFSYEAGSLDVAELADMLQQVSCWAPGQSFHSGGSSPPASWASSSSSSNSSSGASIASSSSCSSGSMLAAPPVRIDPDRLRGALQRSLVCVAAFAPESSLPPHQHLATRSLLPDLHPSPPSTSSASGSSMGSGGAGGPLPWGVPFPVQQQRQRRVLVGFARAVGDASLVATVHDVAVLPELQRLGLGTQLLRRLIKQLNTRGIIDIGLLAPDSSRGFFSACSFGRDTENSTVMTLPDSSAQRRAGLPLEGMDVYLKPPRAAAR